MGFKDLFITSDETTDKKQSEKVVSKTTDSDSGNKFPTFQIPVPSTQQVNQSTQFVQTSDDQVKKFLDMYQSKFESLNQPGYDFFEFFQAILSGGGVDNPQMYIMAMTMGSAMDKTNTKDKLLSTADYYLNELNKLYQQNDSGGTQKKNDLINQKDNENKSLTDDLANLTSQLSAITVQIDSKKNQLSLIDSKYQPLINEIDSKLRANDIAKENVIGNITKVKTGINNNIK